MIVIFQRRVPTVIAAMIATTLLASIVVAVDARGDGDLYRRLALVPMHVWHGQVWRLFTWAVIEPGPLSLLWTCVGIYWFGGDLVSVWGSARFASFAAAVVGLAAVGTSLAGLILPTAWWYPHLGGYALDSAMLIAWALQFPEARIRVYRVLVLGGTTLAYGTVGITLLFAIFYGVSFVLPELIAEAIALLVMTGGLAPVWRRLRRLRRRFGSVPGGRHGGPYRAN